MDIFRALAAAVVAVLAVAVVACLRWQVVTWRHRPGEPVYEDAMRRGDRWLTVCCAVAGAMCLAAAGRDAQMYLLAGGLWALGILTAANGWRRGGR